MLWIRVGSTQRSSQVKRFVRTRVSQASGGVIIIILVFSWQSVFIRISTHCINSLGLHKWSEGTCH